MGFLSSAVSAAIGYSISETSKSHPLRDEIDRRLGNKTLDEIVDDYARSFMGVNGRNNDFANRLHRLAEKYEEYNYDQVYGRRY